MTSIVNVFSNFNDLIKPKSVIDNVSNYTDYVKSNSRPSPAIIQGKKFEKYQNKMINNLEHIIKKGDLVEGFQGIKGLDLNKNGLTKQSINRLNDNDYSSQQQIISNLKNEYEKTLKEYQTLKDTINENIKNYVARVDPTNPYLNKVIQLKGGELFYVTNEGIAKQFTDMNIYDKTVGKNGFPPKGQITQISIPWDNSYESPGAIIPTKPQLITGNPVQIGESVGNEGVNVFVNSKVKNMQSSYIGCYNNIDEVKKANNKSAMTNVGKMNFSQCQTIALNSDNKYFGLQSVDDNGVGNCMLSNDLAGSKIYGNGIKYTKTTLWETKTNDKNGAYATLTDTGSLTVLTGEDKTIYSTPGEQKKPSNFLGCYADKNASAMVNNSWPDGWMSLDKCKQNAIDKKFKYYGGQVTTKKKGVDVDWCYGSNDLSQATKYGLSKSCKTIDGVVHGGPSANALYSVEADGGKYFLILQDDGNMGIYRGSSPSDDQGFIWGTNSNGKQQNPNPNFTAVKGKYGKNWISSGTNLARGDFVGSNNGSIFLIMQNDGNLGLYTSSVSSKCSNYGDKTVGAENTNALYEITNMGKQMLLGELGYIDDNSVFHSYPSNNIKYSNEYTYYTGIDSKGNDISGAAYGNSTVDKCKASCSSNNKCSGFAFSNNVCYPKTSGMFPKGPTQINKNVNLYTRNKAPIKLPAGVPSTVINIDTITYDNYKNGDVIGSRYGISNISTTQKQQLSQIQTKLNLLTSQINGYTDKFSNGTDTLNNQSSKNTKGVGDYLIDFEKTNNNIKNFNTNIENILNDSDIIVLQKNYDYLFWSILAAGTVLVTMNISKNQ
jgi:hypothetical protein